MDMTPPYTLPTHTSQLRFISRKLLIDSRVKVLPAGMAVQNDEVVRAVSNPFTASLKRSAKNTCVSKGLLATSRSSSHLRVKIMRRGILMFAHYTHSSGHIYLCIIQHTLHKMFLICIEIQKSSELHHSTKEFPAVRWFYPLRFSLFYKQLWVS